MAIALTQLVMTCDKAVTECPVVTSPLIGYSTEAPDSLPPAPIFIFPDPSFGPTYLGRFSPDVFSDFDLGIDGWPII